MTSHYLNQWWFVYRRIYASLGLNVLSQRSSNLLINTCMCLKNGNYFGETSTFQERNQTLSWINRANNIYNGGDISKTHNDYNRGCMLQCNNKSFTSSMIMSLVISRMRNTRGDNNSDNDIYEYNKPVSQMWSPSATRRERVGIQNGPRNVC